MSDTVEPDDPRLPRRGLLGMVILSLPILGVLVVFVAYGVMWSLGTSGRSATGAETVLRFEGCAEARPLLAARLSDMGLQGKWRDRPGGFEVSTVLTGDPEVDEGVPAVLSLPGALEVTGGEAVLATNRDLREATVRMDIFMVPYVLLRLHDAAADRVRAHVRADPGGKLRFLVDGQDIGWQSNQNPVGRGELEINVDEAEEQARMRAVANWSVTLDHGPLPCPVIPR